ncbi:MAG: hypothetical protein ABIL09_04550 [Gemmatimonadota bacterium]
MPITVAYQPDANLVSQAAIGAGQGEYRKWLAEQQQRERMQRAALEAQAQAQARAAGIQAERDARMQGYHGENVDREYTLRGHEMDFQSQLRDYERDSAVQRGQAAEETAFTTAQRRDLEKYNNAEQWVRSQDSWNDEQKETAIRQIQAKRMGIQPGAMPQEKGPDLEKELSTRFKRDEDGNTIILQPDGQLDYRPAKKAAQDNADHPLKPPTFAELDSMYQNAIVAKTTKKIVPGKVGADGKPGPSTTVDVPPSDEEVDAYVDKLIKKRAAIAGMFQQSMRQPPPGAEQPPPGAPPGAEQPPPGPPPGGEQPAPSPQQAALANPPTPDKMTEDWWLSATDVDANAKDFGGKVGPLRSLFRQVFKEGLSITEPAVAHTFERLTPAQQQAVALALKHSGALAEMVALKGK